MKRVFVICLALFGLCVYLLTDNSMFNAHEKMGIHDRIDKLNSATVALVDEDGEIYCTGVFINETDILTAKHCLVEDISVLELMNINGVVLTDEMLVKSVLFVTNLDYKMNHRQPNRRANLVSIEKSDIVLLRITRPTHHGSMPVLKGNPTIGEDVDIVGHTMGLGWTYGRGFVSFPHRVEQVPLTSVYSSLIQIDSSLNRGNSGGGIFDRRGNLIGIVSFISSSVPSMSFATHTNVIRSFLRRANVKFQCLD